MLEKKPNFFIVGAAKSGTTSMHFYLKQHPEIFMTEQKETNYFVFKGKRVEFKGPEDDKYINKYSITQLDEYLKLFEGVKNEKIIGESSPSYLYYAKIAAKNIKEFNPNAKILIVLRNPMERAFSAYQHLVRDKREFLGFYEALKEEEKRKQKKWEFIWHYKRAGLYADSVKIYKENFPSENVFIVIFEEFIKNPLKILKKILNFLDVRDDFVPYFSYIHNVSRVEKDFLYNTVNTEKFIFFKNIIRLFIPRKYRLLIKYKINLMAKEKIKIDERSKEYLKEFFREDVLKLSNLLNKDLTFWLR